MLLPIRIALCLATLVLVGCGTIAHERARFDGVRLSNPTFGRGVYYRLPKDYAMLSPWSPVPPKPQNSKFEGFLRGVVAVNDKTDPLVVFREALLFRNDDRYLVIIHTTMNHPYSFNSLPPGGRAQMLPDVAALAYRYFNVPQKDFDYEFRPVGGYTAVVHPPFRAGATSPAGQTGKGGQDWRGIGFTFMGAYKDVTYVFFFARLADLPLAESDFEVFMANFRYGSPPRS